MLSRIGGEAVVGEVASPVRLDEAGVPEHAQVLGDRAGRDAQTMGQGPDAERLLRQEANDLTALLHGERPEDARHVRLVPGAHVF